MSALQAAAANIPAGTLVHLRRPLLIAIALRAAGFTGLVVCTVLGHPVTGILGLGSRLLNTRLPQKFAAQVIAARTEQEAVGFPSEPVIVLRPDSLGVFFGLAAFHVVIVANTAMPPYKEERSS